ncbi:methyltransferase domain-containing protein [Streptomyces sp. 3MP-14]|uniref:Methyltransferase domain-containing protein n=1 Tax=Streptomyces mimosae TaxID=2586635 RepID=A0A5N5ZWW9_9ACTN|nr:MULTISPECIES: methyltransferase domain-containing protein [Streptomyces]KAB8160226.1 methyltransferase domain-containing protein [Streptomyces mimosae]KAB8173012.1 methyltransferase domain-containing protein [Streptomyces sp. 3MP-14]
MAPDIKLDVPVVDTVHLEGIPGVIERLLQECHDIGKPLLDPITLTYPDSVVTHLDGPLRPLAELRLYSAFSIVLGPWEHDDPDHTAAIDALRHSRHHGVLGLLSGEEELLRFRVDAIPERPALCDAIESHLGWRNDPRNWHINLVRRGKLLLAQVGALYFSRRFPEMRRIPASTNPVVGALMIRLLKPRRGNTVWDPFCGAGTLLVEAAHTGLDLTLIGSDTSPEALAAAHANHPLFPTGTLLRANAAALPARPGTVDRVMANLPFGKRVGSHAANRTLYPRFLAELARVLTPDGRAVLLTEDKRLLRASVERTRDVRVIKEVTVSTGGLHPSAYTVERTRTARRKQRTPRPPATPSPNNR